MPKFDKVKVPNDITSFASGHHVHLYLKRDIEHVDNIDCTKSHKSNLNYTHEAAIVWHEPSLLVLSIFGITNTNPTARHQIATHEITKNNLPNLGSS